MCLGFGRYTCVSLPASFFPPVRIPYFETSAVTGVEVERAVTTLLGLVMKRMEQSTSEGRSGEANGSPVTSHEVQEAPVRRRCACWWRHLLQLFLLFFLSFFFKFLKVTLQVKLVANLRFQNRAVRSLPRGVPSVTAVWCYLFSCATMSEEDFPWLCFLRRLSDLSIYINMYAQMGH